MTVIRDNECLQWVIPVGGGTHEHIIQEKDSPFFSLNDLPSIVINGFHHVIRTNQITAAAAQQLREINGREAETAIKGLSWELNI